MDGHNIMSLVWALALLLLIGPAVLTMYRGQGNQALAHLALWLALFVAVGGGYKLFQGTF